MCTCTRVSDRQSTHKDNRSPLIDKQENATIEYVVSRYPAHSYGERIRQRRLELGLTQVELAKRLGVNEMTVVGWEKGWHHPRAALKRRLETFLGLR